MCLVRGRLIMSYWSRLEFCRGYTDTAHTTVTLVQAVSDKYNIVESIISLGRLDELAKLTSQVTSSAKGSLPRYLQLSFFDCIWTCIPLTTYIRIHALVHATARSRLH